MIAPSHDERLALDQWIAEHVMGLRPGVDFGLAPSHSWCEIVGDYSNYIQCDRCYEVFDDNESLAAIAQIPNLPACTVSAPWYSHEIGEAWGVLGRMPAVLTPQQVAMFGQWFDDQHMWLINAEEVAHRICWGIKHLKEGGVL